ncbi:hypothetical protein BD779DRAFT_1565286 [Infundibulicybe gibba]|nr:hypothetical protein BD779DRAFT_1565286 [Infundibulicybe gibba]
MPCVWRCIWPFWVHVLLGERLHGICDVAVPPPLYVSCRFEMLILTVSVVSPFRSIVIITRHICCLCKINASVNS